MNNHNQNRQVRRIDGEQRFYEIEGLGRFPSVTTILNIIGKPALANWKLSVAINYLKGLPPEKMSPEGIFEVLELAKKKPAELTKEALDIGSRVHEILEEAVKAHIQSPIVWSDFFANYQERGEVMNCLSAFVKWAAENDFEPVLSELTVYSTKKKFAGTLDCVAKVNGKMFLIDFKSSKAYYAEMALQLAAYRYALKERRPDLKIRGMAVMRLGKLDGEFEFIKVKYFIKNFAGFLAAKKLWNWQNL